MQASKERSTRSTSGLIEKLEDRRLLSAVAAWVPRYHNPNLSGQGLHARPGHAHTAPKQRPAESSAASYTALALESSTSFGSGDGGGTDESQLSVVSKANPTSQTVPVDFMKNSQVATVTFAVTTKFTPDADDAEENNGIHDVSISFNTDGGTVVPCSVSSSGGLTYDAASNSFTVSGGSGIISAQTYTLTEQISWPNNDLGIKHPSLSGSVTLTDGGAKAVSAIQNITIPTGELDLKQPDGTEVPRSKRLNPGGYIPLNRDYDNGSTTPDMGVRIVTPTEDDLVPLVLHNSGKGGRYQLEFIDSGPGQTFRIWAKPDKSAADGADHILNLPTDGSPQYRIGNNATIIDAGTDTTFWVEGIQDSSAVAADMIKLRWKAATPSNAPYNVADMISLTVYEINAEWLQATSSLDTNPGLNGGTRIFPDKLTPTDSVPRDVLGVTATTTPALPAGTSVYFQSYDVDDPSVDPTFKIDQNDNAGSGRRVVKGLDNRGTEPGQRGTFPTAGIDYRASAVLSPGGKVSLPFQVTKQPGDNFRIGVALSGPELDKVNDDTVTPDNKSFNKSVAGLTDMLTVWRHLWVERDSMTGVVANTIPITISSVSRLVPTAGGTNDVITISGRLPDSEDAFEGGQLSIPSLGITVPVYLNSDNLLYDDTINVPGGTFTGAQVAAISAAPVTGTLTDDDVIPASGTMPLPDGGSLSQTAFGEAYILPKYVDPGSGSLNKRGTVPFVRHVSDSIGQLKVSRDLTSSSDFWSTLVVGCFENYVGSDGDPDGIAPPGLGIPSPTTDDAFEYGASDADTSAIFLETVDDFVRQRNFSTDENHTVTHEIGHTVGSGIKHFSTGIMRPGAPKIETAFADENLATFRGVDTW